MKITIDGPVLPWYTKQVAARKRQKRTLIIEQ